MQQFSHKKTLNSNTLVVDRMKQKIQRQRAIFVILFVVIAIYVFAYIVLQVSVKYLDGYIISRNTQIRASEDVSILDFYVKPGDIVCEGDTLFSYIYTSWINDAANPNFIPDPDKEIQHSRMEIARLKSQFILQQKSMDSLYLLVKEIEKDLQYGVATRQMMESKEWEYFQMKQQVEHTKRLIDIQREVKANNTQYFSFGENLNPASDYTYKELSNNNELFGKALRYKTAFTDMHIVELNGRIGSLTFKKEPIMTFYASQDLKMSDLHAQVLIPPGMLSLIQDSVVMQIYCGDKYLSDAQASKAIPYMQEVEPYKLSFFSQGKEAVTLRMDLINPEDFPSQYEVDKLPIKLKFDRWKIWTDSFKNFFKKDN